MFFAFVAAWSQLIEVRLLCSALLFVLFSLFCLARPQPQGTVCHMLLLLLQLLLLVV